MEPYLSKALWRAGIKLTVGLAVVGALVGIRLVTVTPVGVEGDLEQLERLEAVLAAEAAGAATGSSGDASASGLLTGAGEAEPTPPAEMDESAPRAASDDLDRLVRCHGPGGLQYMRAADCETRGGTLEELPPPTPEEGEGSAAR